MIGYILSRSIDQEKLKCTPYWPGDILNPFISNHFTILLLELTKTEVLVTRKLLLTNILVHLHSVTTNSNLQTNESREVLHLQFLQFSNYGVPPPNTII